MHANPEFPTLRMVAHPLVPVAGELPVVRPDVDADALRRTAAPAPRVEHWRRRLDEVRRLPA